MKTKYAIILVISGILLFSPLRVEAQGETQAGETQKSESKQGVVTLKGSVKSEKQERKIIELAENVVSVKSVRADLSVEK